MAARRADVAVAAGNRPAAAALAAQAGVFLTTVVTMTHRNLRWPPASDAKLIVVEKK